MRPTQPAFYHDPAPMGKGSSCSAQFASLRRAPFGRNRNGSRRHRCDTCNRTFTDKSTRPEDRRRLPREKAILCLRLLLEGNSIRSVERPTGVHRDTISTTMVEPRESAKPSWSRL
jgi:transposase-like protein